MMNDNDQREGIGEEVEESSSLADGHRPGITGRGAGGRAAAGRFSTVAQGRPSVAGMRAVSGVGAGNVSAPSSSSTVRSPIGRGSVPPTPPSVRISATNAAVSGGRMGSGSAVPPQASGMRGAVPSSAASVRGGRPSMAMNRGRVGIHSSSSSESGIDVLHSSVS